MLATLSDRTASTNTGGKMTPQRLQDIKLNRATAGAAYKAKNYNRDVDDLLAEIQRLQSLFEREKIDPELLKYYKEAAQIDPKELQRLRELERGVIKAGYGLPPRA